MSTLQPADRTTCSVYTSVMLHFFSLKPKHNMLWCDSCVLLAMWISTSHGSNNHGNFFLLVFITNSNKPVVGLSYVCRIWCTTGSVYTICLVCVQNDAQHALIKCDTSVNTGRVCWNTSKHAKWGVTHSILSKDDGKHDSPGRTQSVKSLCANT